MITTPPFLARAAAVSALVLSLAACSKNDTTNPDGTPTGERSTDTFNGTVAAHTATWHTFTVKTAGSVDVTLTSLTPLPTSAIGVGIGTTPINGCQVQAWNNAAVQGTVLTAPINTGTFCVTVYDVGNVTDGATYTLTVLHP